MHSGFICQIKLLAFKVNFYLDEVLCYLGFRTGLAPMSAVAGNDRDIWNLEESASQNHHDSLKECYQIPKWLKPYLKKSVDLIYIFSVRIIKGCTENSKVSSSLPSKLLCHWLDFVQCLVFSVTTLCASAWKPEMKVGTMVWLAWQQKGSIYIFL